MSQCYPCETGNHSACRGPDCECNRCAAEEAALDLACALHEETIGESDLENPKD